MTAAEPVYTVLSRLDGVHKQAGYWMARCPAHHDRTASLSVSVGKEQPVILKCHAGCVPADILAALTPPLSWDDLCRPRSVNGTAPLIVAEYKYTDEAGELLFVKERRQPKDFRIRRPDGRGGWLWSLGADTRRVLYRLPQVRDAIAAGQVVYVVEGEKDVHAVESAGGVATCNYDGAAKPGQRPKVRPEYAGMLAGGQVVVVADDDEAGHEHARQWAKLLDGHVKSVQLVLPATGKDAHDHLTAGKALDHFQPLDDSEDLTLPGIPSYPASLIPGPLGAVIDAGTATGLNAAHLGGAGLGVLASLCGPADLEITETWTERAALWVPVVDHPSTGKTPAQRLARLPVDALYAAALQDWHDRLEEWTQEHDRLLSDYQIELDNWNHAPAKERGPKPLAPEIDPAPPRPHSRFTDDVTMEVVCRWLDADDGTGGIVADELKAFLLGLGQYGGRGPGRDRGRIMALWSHAPWAMMRVGQAGKHVGVDLYLPRPVVSIFGNLTPANQYLLGEEDDGFRPRWLLHLGPGLIPAPVDVPVDLSEWTEAVTALYELRHQRTWQLRGEARTVWEQAAKRWRERSRRPEPESVLAALGKADVQCARVALVLAESMAPGEGGYIPVNAMIAAVAITDYSVDCWAALLGGKSFARSRAEEITNDAVTQLAYFLERQPGGKANASDILTAHVAGIRNAEQRAVVLLAYQDAYPGTVKQQQPPGGGRPATVVYAPPRSPQVRSQSSFLPLAGNSITRADLADSTDKPAGQANAVGPEFPATGGWQETWQETPGRKLRDSSESAAAWPPAETGPCSRCGGPCHRYGEGGAPTCASCRPNPPGLRAPETDWLRQQKGEPN